MSIDDNIHKISLFLSRNHFRIGDVIFSTTMGKGSYLFFNIKNSQANWDNYNSSLGKIARKYSLFLCPDSRIEDELNLYIDEHKQELVAIVRKENENAIFRLNITYQEREKLFYDIIEKFFKVDSGRIKKK